MPMNPYLRGWLRALAVLGMFLVGLWVFGRGRKNEAPGGRIGTMKELRGDPRVPKSRTGPLPCASEFTADVAAYRAEIAAATREREDAGPYVRPPPPSAAELQEAGRKQDARKAALAAMSPTELARHATDDELYSAAMFEQPLNPGPVAEHLGLVSNLLAQVSNGGLHQFFHNSTGDRAMETLEAVRAVGNPRLIRLYECALTAFPDGRPSKDFSRRYAELDAWGDEQYDIFDPLTDVMHWKRSEHVEALGKYIRAHVTELGLNRQNAR